MAGNFQDGFPMDPTQAVQAATFLTQQERDEWMTWLTKATPEDKAELVNTLHEIWIENKTVPQAPAAPIAAPAAQPAAMQAPVAPIAPVTPPVPQPLPIQPAAPVPQAAVPAPQAPAAPIPQALPPRPSAPAPQPKVETPKYSFRSVDESTQPAPRPQPKRDDRPAQRDDRRDSRPPRNDDRRPDPRDARNDRPAPQAQVQAPAPQQAKSVAHSNFVDLSKMQTEKTRSILDKFMKDFAQTRRNEEQSLTQLKDAVLGVEEVTNYSDLLAEKILALNNAQVQSNKVASKSRDDLVTKMDDLEIRVDDVQTMIERAQEEVERLARRQRAFESDVKEMLAKVNEQLSGMNGDQFAGSDKVAILSRRLDRIEEVRNTNSRPQPAQPQLREERRETAPVQPPKPARQQLDEMQVEVPQMPDTTTKVDTNSNFMPLKLGNKGRIEE
jgi:hypothetical protein